MTRPRNRVKVKKASQSISSIGLVDIHFHGAFGTDLMTASISQLDEMSRELWKSGIAAFCPTTLSQPPEVLQSVVQKLGQWIRKSHSERALPIGIHLEGPFIHPEACGAHPSHSIRPLNWEELNSLWEQSLGTLKILTLAPETLPAEPNLRKKTLSQLRKWSQERQIKLSLGHSKASEEEASQAFDLGFEGITHAWNALSFHHRAPGALGAGVGRPGTYLEVITDGIHLSPTLIRWLLRLHHPYPICMISDCLSVGGKPSSRSQFNLKTGVFGPFQIQNRDGASRFLDGSLAGGSQLLTESYCRWLKTESRLTQTDLISIFRRTLRHVTTHPLQVLGVAPKSLANRRVLWHIFPSNRICVIPID